jgi:hypothetical protein
MASINAVLCSKNLVILATVCGSTTSFFIELFWYSACIWCTDTVEQRCTIQLRLNTRTSILFVGSICIRSLSLISVFHVAEQYWALGKARNIAVRSSNLPVHQHGRGADASMLGLNTLECTSVTSTRNFCFLSSSR